jgi:hypothetical protein
LRFAPLGFSCRKHSQSVIPIFEELYFSIDAILGGKKALGRTAKIPSQSKLKSSTISGCWGLHGLRFYQRVLGCHFAPFSWNV